MSHSDRHRKEGNSKMKVTYAHHSKHETEEYTSEFWTYMVESSSLNYICHNYISWHTGVLAGQELSDLTVGFTNGSLYTYKEVPTRVVLSLITAESVGKAFHTLIKKGGYEYRKIREATPKEVEV